MNTLKLNGYFNLDLTNNEVVSWKYIDNSPSRELPSVFKISADNVLEYNESVFWYGKPSFSNRELELTIDIIQAFSSSNETMNMISQWANTSFKDNPDEYYHSLELTHYKANREVRTITFPNAYVISYKESFDKENNLFSTVRVGQKIDMAYKVMVNGNAYGLRPTTVNSISGSRLSRLPDVTSGAATSITNNNFSNLEVWLVHGTVGVVNKSGEGPEHWTQEFQNYLLRELGINSTNLHIPDWGGALSQSTRRNEGILLASDINVRLKENPNLSIVLIGYSHGGNVNIRAINHLYSHYQVNTDNVTLITIGTPIRQDYVLNSNININHHINIFNNRDSVQVAGGRLVTIPTGFRNFVPMFIPGGREVSSAENILVDNYVPSGRDENRWGLEAHSSMHNNINVWNRYIITPLKNVL